MIPKTKIDWQKKHLIGTQGLPGSGKTTWARKMVEEHCEGKTPFPVIRANRDDIRRSLGFKFDPRREDEVTVIQTSQINKLLKLGFTVICDDTHLNAKYIRQREEQAEDNGVDFILVDDFMEVPVSTCIKRDLEREASVGKDVIEMLYASYWSHQHIPENNGKVDAIVIDLDGTLALFGKANPFDRDYLKDTLNVPVAMVADWAANNGFVVILTSGREERHKSVTHDWLTSEMVDYDYLYMRETHDKRPDTVVKKEIYMRHIQGNYKIAFVMDDRPSVVRMWRSELGLPVFQVAPNVEF